MKKSVFVSFVLVALGLFAHSVEARLPKDSDLSTLIEDEQSEYEIASDGTYSYVFSTRIAILTEAGRESEAVKTIQFNARASTLEIIDARTILPDREIPVAKSNIEIKEVGDSKVFDAMKQAIISFPSVEVGSKIFYKFRMKVTEVPIPDFFSAGFGVALGNIDSFRFHLRSRIPLKIHVNDSERLFEISQKEERGVSVVEVKNRHKVRYGVVQEDSPFVEADRLPAIFISTREAGQWKDFAKEVLGYQERELAKDLPPVMKAIAEKVKALPTERRMATVAALVAERFRYFGDWRRRAGGHLPRSLAEIAETGYGDCKDMSLTVVAIARAIGLKADLAWVWRGEVPPGPKSYILPSEASFNHAIARVEDGDRVFWVDATNPVAMPDGKVLADIADRQAFVLSKSGSRLERTPELKVTDSVIDVAMDIRFLDSGSVAMDGHFIQRGRAATRGEWALLSMPLEHVEYEMARWLARNEKLDSFKVTLPTERTRIVRDLDMKAHVEIEGIGLRTTAGLGFPLFRNDTIDLLMIDGKDRFSDLWLGAPGRYRESYTIKNAKMVGRENLNCSLKNEFVELRREIRNRQTGVSIETAIDVLASVVPSKKIESAEFQRFQRQVRNCFNRSAVILSVSKAKK
ncbi:MAG: DUF3857 domain-containing protein [Bdellovibrionaceae bacterium]|nr:DUF3857 domain-containing protein [Pseudobdellovibrionaceae bacterium]